MWKKKDYAKATGQITMKLGGMLQEFVVTFFNIVR